MCCRQAACDGVHGGQPAACARPAAAFRPGTRETRRASAVVRLRRADPAYRCPEVDRAAAMNHWASSSLSPSVRAGSRKSQGPNLSMSGSNQHLMRINLRRMELSVFIEVSSTNRSKGGDRATRKAPRRKGSAVLGPAFLMLSNLHRGHLWSTNGSLLGFWARHL